MDELKPCPFCGSEEIWFASDQNKLWSGDCQGCGARSPNSATKKGSIAVWNTRPLENALRAQLDDWESREAAICPEDVGFEEYIHRLKRNKGTLRAQLDVAMKAITTTMDVHEDDNGVTITIMWGILRDALSEIAKMGGGK